MSQTAQILVVDDDPEIRSLLQAYLSRNGFATQVAADGNQMWSKMQQFPIELVVLDVMLPGEDGLSLCRKLQNKANVAIIMLSARGEDVDRILGLEMGADDYLPKPFNPRELLARIHSVLRRNPNSRSQQQHTKYRFGGWELDSVSRSLMDDAGTLVSLSGAEYELLHLFLNHPHEVLSRDQIMEQLKGRDSLPYDRSIDIQISRLRRRLRDDGKAPKMIKTVRGTGYVLAVSVEQVS